MGRLEGGELRQEGGEEGREGGNRKKKKKRKTSAKCNDSYCMVAAPVHQEGFLGRCTCSEQPALKTIGVIPLMHALKTGQLQEINRAEFYYSHMSKKA